MSQRGLNATVLAVLALAILNGAYVAAEHFPLSIIHINDLHARYEPTDKNGGTCDAGEECIGGYGRTVSTVKRLLEEQKHQNAIYINAGDSFQGTLWYNIGRWNVTSQFLNMLPADIMTLGNHEFDHGVEGVVPFLETVDTNMLVANMDSTNEPSMTGKYNRSTIIERNNRKIGVIGVILETTYDLANTGKLIFTNESETILEEAEKLKAQGANIIIVVSHCGYDVDKIIAQNAGSVVDVIVGSHSHTFLYTGDNPPGPDTPRGDYPTEVIHESGHRVLILQAGCYAKYVGNITVFFDDDGNVVDHEGAPIYMGANVPQDEDVETAMIPWREVIDAQGNVIVGQNLVTLQKSTCSSGECNLGNFFCDAMVYAFANATQYTDKSWSTVPIGLVNTGALRVELAPGNLTYAHMVTMSPFENILTAFDLQGRYLKEALEFSVQSIDLDNGVTSSAIFVQVSGLRLTFDMRKPVGDRVIGIKVRCSECEIPYYEDFSADKVYRIVVPSFLAEGGDGFRWFRDFGSNYQPLITDLDALLAYTKAINPIYTRLDGRIVVYK